MTFSNDKLLFVFEMANNHMGDVEHGLRIIKSFHEVSRDFPFVFGFKFQYRDLDTFIHKDYKTRFDYKYVKRFTETRLATPDFLKLKDQLTNLGFLSVCTPFDEKSVDHIESQNYDFIKIASCSFTDWPLLERIALADKPIIASTAAASLDDIDKVVSFFKHRDKELALMHCVAEYPTANSNLQLNQIDLLRDRYPGIPVGYSTHEAPENCEAVKLAIAKGAIILEKHVGLPAPGIELNSYSANPDQVRRWLESACQAVEMCGVKGCRYSFTGKESSDLLGLRRGVFAGKPLRTNQQISISDISLAIPLIERQITANDLSKYNELILKTSLDSGQPIMFSDVEIRNNRDKIYEIVQKVKTYLNNTNVVVPGAADLEISHHYGIDRFYEYGITMITVVNRDYCKKLIIVLPGQQHPEQHHEVKEETFHVLDGEIHLVLDGARRICNPGDVIVVERGVKHSFSSPSGAVIEEISSTHLKQDSFYSDPVILQNLDRKTLLTHWMG